MSVVEIERGSPLYQRLRGGGLVVSAVEQDSRAWQAGFRAGRHHLRRQPPARADARRVPDRLRGAQGGYAVSLLRGDFNVTIIVR